MSETLNPTTMGVRVCGVDCHPGDAFCNGYCRGERPEAASKALITPAPMSDDAIAEARRYVESFHPDSPLYVVATLRELLTEVDRLRSASLGGRDTARDAALGKALRDAVQDVEPFTRLAINRTLPGDLFVQIEDAFNDRERPRDTDATRALAALLARAALSEQETR